MSTAGSAAARRYCRGRDGCAGGIRHPTEARMTEVRIDDEAVIWSASAADRAGRPLLLLLHGYNSNEGDLFGLAPYLPLEPAIASLRAPIFTGYGNAWFHLPSEHAEFSLAG